MLMILYYNIDVPECMDFEFTCESGHCIPVHFLCDGEYDCGPGDYSDENNENCEGMCMDVTYLRRNCVHKNNVMKHTIH